MYVSCVKTINYELQHMITTYFGSNLIIIRKQLHLKLNWDKEVKQSITKDLHFLFCFNEKKLITITASISFENERETPPPGKV